MRLVVATAAALAASLTGLLPGVCAEDTQPALADWTAVPVVALHEAAELRMVDVEGTRADGYKAIHIELTNRSDDRVAVDVAGSHLLPVRRGSCQRLGIGPAITPSAATTREDGSVVVQLEPRETRELDVRTCCLDARKSVPGRQRFVAARLPLPAHRRNVLRWWAENPAVPQSYVNGAIWRDAESVTLPAGWEGGTERSKPHDLVLHGGVAYTLSAGELIALEPDGVRRFLGTEIRCVMPTNDAVYAVANGEDGRPDLWRLAMTGEDPWSFVLDLEKDERVHRVLPVGREGALLLVSDSGVAVHAPNAQPRQVLKTEHPEHLSVRDLGNGRLRIGVYQPRVRKDPNDERSGKSSFFELWDMDLRSEGGKSVLFKRFWNVDELRCGPAGVFARSPRGVLRRLDRKTFRDLPRDPVCREIVEVGREVIWVRDELGRIRAIHAQTGRVAAVADRGDVDGKTRFSVDHVTDELGLAVQGAYDRISPADGSRTRLELPE